MTSNHFSRPTFRTRPPPYCKSLLEPLPPLVPTLPTQYVQAYGTLLDNDPLAFNDISSYFKLLRLGAAWIWSDVVDLGHCTFGLALLRLADPQPWVVTIAVPGPPQYAFSYTWPPFVLNFDPTWDTGHLTMTWPPSYDKVTARITT